MDSNTLVALFAAMGASADKQDGNKTLFVIGGLSVMFYENTDIWAVRNEEAKKWIRSNVTKVTLLLEAEKALVKVPVSQPAEPVVEKKAETPKVINLLDYLNKEVGKPSLSMPGFQSWDIGTTFVAHNIDANRWGMRSIADKQLNEVSQDVIVKKLLGDQYVSDTVVDEAFTKLGEPRIEPVVEKVPVIEVPVKERLFAFLNEKVKGALQPNALDTVWYLTSGWCVMYESVNNRWRYCLRVNAPMVRISPEQLWTKLNPPVPTEPVKKDVVKEVVKMDDGGVKKIAVVEWMKSNKKLVTRTPYTEAHRRNKVKFGSKLDDDPKFFRAYGPYAEVPWLLEDALDCTYIEFVTDDSAVAERVMNSGYQYEGIHYKCLFGYQRDDRATAYLVPDAMTNLVDLRSVGIWIELNDLEKCLKAGKYLNREMAPTWVHALGKPVKFDVVAGIGVYRLDNGAIITVKFNSIDGLTDDDAARLDGGGLVGEHGAKSVGLSKHPRIGDAWQCTIGERYVGMPKGNFVYKEDLEYDFVVYGSKTMIKNERFYFGCFGKLKKIMPFSDMQSWDNFRFERPGMIDYQAQLFRLDYWNKTMDNKEITKLLVKYINSVRDDEHYYNDGISMIDWDAWVLREAVINGWSALKYPGLGRRVNNFMMYRVMQMERGRIPLDKVAVSGYCIHDPYMHDTEGNLLPIEDELIGKDECCMMDIPAGILVACYRQPNENQNAFVILKNIHHQRYARFAGKGIIILGAGCNKVLARLGGGDLDDRFIVVFDEFWVNKFKELNDNPYPETAKIKKSGAVLRRQFDEEAEAEGYKIPGRGVKEWYNNRHFAYQIDRKQRSGAGIGPVVNANMIDNRLSNAADRAYMFEQLDAEIAEAKRFGNLAKIADLEATREWFVMRPLYQMRKFETNLEHVIDGVVLDANILVQLGNVSDAVRQFHSGLQEGREPVENIGLEGTLIYPYIATMGKRISGKDTLRIPTTKVAKADYHIYDSLMCKSLKDLTHKRDVLIDRLKLREWISVAPADEAFVFEMGGHSPDIAVYLGSNPGRKREDAPGYIQVWRGGWKAILGAGNPMTREGLNEAYKKVENDCAEYLAQFDDDTVKQMAVELLCYLYHTIYADAQYVVEGEEMGKRKSFPDGMLWTKRMGNAIIQASRDIKYMDIKTRKLRPITGLVVPVDLDEEFAYDLGEAKVDVVIKEAGIVYRLSTMEAIGTIPVRLEDEGIEFGGFTMEDGMVILRESHESLLPQKNYEAFEEPNPDEVG